MNWIRQLRERRQLQQDLAEEIELHLQERIDTLVETGMSKEEAWHAARREFGNVTLTNERGREVWHWVALEDFFTDVRFALRQLRKSKAFALAGVLTMALGIGANTTVFSVVNAVMLRPLSYSQPERLVSVKTRDARTSRPAEFSYPTFFDFRERSRTLDHLVCYRDEEFTLTGDGQAMHLRGYIVSWDLFPMLGVQPVLGRGFLPSEEKEGEQAVVLSYELWKTRLGADPAIIGKTVRVDSRPHTVVGVAPPGFTFPVDNAPAQIWTTLARDSFGGENAATKQRGARMLDTMARLKAGVSLQQAQADTDSVAAGLAKQYPETNKNFASTFVRPALDTVVGNARDPLLIILGAVGLVLLMACANIANLLLARTTERAREFALRAAIGAGRWRIIRQVITEGLTVALIGCTAGVLGAMAALRAIPPLVENAIPRIMEARIDGRVLAFSAGIAVLSSILFSLAPVWRIRKGGFSGVLHEGSRSSTDSSDRMRSVLCVGQIALGLVLMSAASVLTASFLNLMHSDIGFSPQRLLSCSLSLPNQDYPSPRRLAFYDRLIEDLNHFPGVVSAAAATPLPLLGSQISMGFDIEGRPTDRSNRHRSDMAIIMPTYFKTLGIPLFEGREFVSNDNSKSLPVVIVNRAFANKFFPGESAVGKRIQHGAGTGPPKMSEIVGVVGNAKQSALRDAAPIYYLPYQQMPWCCPSVVVRTAGTAPSLSSVQTLVSSLDKQLAVYEIRSMEEIRSRGVAVPRFQMLLLSTFAVIALLLTAVGLYGVLAYSVLRQTREIGVRVALGATRGEVLRLVLRRAVLLVILGVGIGIPGALGAGRLLASALHGVAPHDPVLLATASLIILSTALAAAYLPARRAASIDPVQALRAE